jgi:hypothetical protein
MATEDVRTILVRLEGLLKAFEWINHKTNHGCNFFICQMPKAESVPVALADYFKLKPSDFRVEPIADVDRGMRDVFGRFLFLFQDPHGDHLVDPRRSFSLMDEFGRQSLLDELAGVVRSLGTTAAWRIRASLDCGELREWCFQDDVVLELAEGFCLFHFGVSD